MEIDTLYPFAIGYFCRAAPADGRGRSIAGRIAQTGGGVSEAKPTAMGGGWRVPLHSTHPTTWFLLMPRHKSYQHYRGGTE